MEDASLHEPDVEAAAPASAATVDTPLSPNELPLEQLWNSLDEPGFAEAVTEGDKHGRLQSFLSITAVQQTLVLTLGSLAYDAGSIAYVTPTQPRVRACVRGASASLLHCASPLLGTPLTPRTHPYTGT
jgi:hypothetical protein